MLTQENYEYLKNLSNLGRPIDFLGLKKVWYFSDETLISVARILSEVDTFLSKDKVIDFFESPHKWTKDIQNLIKEYERELEPSQQ